MTTTVSGCPLKRFAKRTDDETVRPFQRRGAEPFVSRGKQVAEV
jgi:EAL domain-containing protein (putative c-di-GMP-specific phosphodiesterase class I)